MTAHTSCWSPARRGLTSRSRLYLPCPRPTADFGASFSRIASLAKAASPPLRGSRRPSQGSRRLGFRDSSVKSCSGSLPSARAADGAPVVPPQPWLPDPTHLIQPLHLDLLRGLVWCCGSFSDPELAQALAELAITSYRKLPGKGARLETLGSACIAALRAMGGKESIGPLTLMKARVKFGKAEIAIEKGLAEAAERIGIRRDELDELSVPAYGLDGTGGRREKIGDYTAVLRVDSGVTLRWQRGDGQPLKTTPASLKKDYSGELKDLQNSVKAIGLALSTQRQRLDGLYLNRKSWPFDEWCERYRDHPLIGAVSRKLIWRFNRDGTTTDGVWLGGGMIGHDEVELKRLNKKTTVTLWHPLDSHVADVLAWRAWLDGHEIRQPFKQAHREVYVLTDAERQHDVYSNRFAAHILRQHQFHALCASTRLEEQTPLDGRRRISPVEYV